MGDGQWELTPEPDFNGRITLSYVINDGDGGKTFTTKNIEIDAVNDQPELREGAVLDLNPINEEDSITISANDILNKYTDKDGENLEIAGGELTLADESAGTLEGNIDDGWKFTAAENYNGIARFNFEIQDNEVKTPGTLTLQINGINDSPIAGNGNTYLADSSGNPLSIDEEEELHIKYNNLIDGISDVDNEINELEITYVYSENGVIRTIEGEAGWFFMPEQNYNGEATITYGISDGNGGLLEHTRTLNINPIDDKPILITAPNVFTDIPEDTSLKISRSDLLAFYGDAMGTRLISNH